MLNIMRGRLRVAILKMSLSDITALTIAGRVRTLHFMDVEFEDEDLRRLACDPSYDMGLPRGIVKAYRMRIQLIAAAIDERAFYSLSSWHFEKLKGDLAGKHSIRLNNQWRLLIKLEKRESGKTVVVICICDYH